MTPDLFGRPGSYPVCPRGDCNQGRSCDCVPARRVDNERQWRVSGWAVPLLGVVGFLVIVFFGG